MKWSAALIVLLLLAAACAGEEGEGWISLFDGRSLEGWKAGENASTRTSVEVNPALTSCQEAPPSVDLKTPPPVPASTVWSMA